MPAPQICPLMSQPKEPKLIVGPAGAQKQEITGLIPCVGPQCAMYAARANAEGKIVGGSCGIVSIPMVLGELTRLSHLVARATSPQYAQEDDDAMHAQQAQMSGETA